MANLSNIARPYALAAFESAREKNQLDEWRAFLTAAAQVASDKSVLRVLGNPQSSSSQLHALFAGVLSKELNTERDNLLRLLAQNRRLMVLPQIAVLFDGYCEQLEKISKVRVVTAVKIDEDYRQKLAKALSKRTQREVTLECEIDPSILGGAIIHMGDRVIDGSIRGKLNRLLEFSLR